MSKRIAYYSLPLGSFCRQAFEREGKGGFGREGNAREGKGGFGRKGNAREGKGGFGRKGNAILSHLKLPFPSLSNACHAGYFAVC